MSIFDNVRNVPVDPSIHSWIKIKYGDMAITREWLAALPDAVIERAAQKMGYSLMNPEKRYYEETLYINLHISVIRHRTIKAIMDALVEYHTLWA